MEEESKVDLEDTLSNISEIKAYNEQLDEDIELEENEEKKDEGQNDNNKKTIILIVLLAIVALIVFVALLGAMLSLFEKKSEKENNYNKNNTASESNIVINEDSNSNSNEINNNPDYEIIATFYGNGATLDKYEAMCVTEDKEKGCEINIPNIKREGASILGFSTDKNAKTGTVTPNSKITIKEDVTYFAITKKNVVVTFTYPRGERANQTQNCILYNDEDNCKITFPEYISKGGFDNTWSSQKDLKGKMYKAGESLNIKDTTTFYASYHHPYWSDSSNIENYYKDRNLTISRVVNIGSTRFEYESGIPSSAITNHIKFINEVHAKTPWIFTPGKVFVLTPETYNKISTAYGLTFGEDNYNYIDIQYDESIETIDDNATIHELAHAWDAYYRYRKGTSISSQSDIQKLYNSLTSEQRKDLSAIEWFAGTSTEYYWHYLGMNTEKESFAGYKDYMTEEQQKEYVTLYEKYANISKNGYR